MTQTLKKVGNYKFIRKIGSGATSEVFEGRKEGELDRFAIKMIKIKSMSKEQIEMIAKEVTIIKNINHPHIVRLHEALVTPNHYYLIFQFCEKGDLEKYLKENLGSLLALENVRKIINCIAQAVKHLHSLGIAHRDIKLANVLLKKDFTIKLADFGFAKETNSQEIMMSTYCGTPITMAPQILKGKPYDKKCDLWSLGVILFQLTFGKLPFPIDKGYAVFIEKVTTEKVKIPSKPQIPNSLKQLIYRCLQTDQANRYSIEQFLGSEWISETTMIESIQEQKESVNEILKKVARQSKKIEYATQEIEENMSVSVFERLLSERISNILENEINKVLNRHMIIRKQIIKLAEDNKDLLQSLYYYDYLILNRWHEKKVKLRIQGQHDVFIPLKSLKYLNFPESLAEDPGDPIQVGVVLPDYLKKLSTMDIELEKKKNRYNLVINFLEFVQNFELEITLFFNNNYQLDFSLQNLANYIIDGNICEEEKEYHKGLNHITIALQCREKDERFRQAANTLKMSCQKRIDDIQREINGY